MRTLIRSIAAGFAIALAAGPAAATQFAYDFATRQAAGSTAADWYTLASPYSLSGTALGGTASYAPGVTATITGWNYAANSSGSGSIAQSYLGRWDGGLGVVAPQAAGNDTCAQGWGYCGEHQIDNATTSSTTPISRDFVQITFSRAVTLASVTRLAYANTSSGTATWDDDFAYGSAKSSTSTLGVITGNVASEGFADLKKLISTDVSSTGGCNANQTFNNEKVCFDWTGVSTGSSNKTASTTWWIAASLLNPDNKADSFKLYDFTVLYNDNPADAVGQVPEPASWMTMIVGFGAIGFALRRRKAAEQPAAA